MTKEEEEDPDPNYVPSFINNADDVLPDSEDGNGSVIENIYVPDEIMIQILSYIDANKLLRYSLVCRKWNNLIKSYPLWSLKYKNKYNRKTKQLPWFVYYSILSTKYFDTNLVKNGNGQEFFDHWEFVSNGGDQCTIENPPNGADHLPPDVPEFNGHSSCFATSYGDCHKKQLVNLGQNKLFHYIINAYKPHIYLSEWTAGRFDCGCFYIMRCGFVGKNITQRFLKPCAMHYVVQFEGRKWEKIEMTITEYPENVEALEFENIGRDTQFWKGHYGSKMAGGVLKFLSSSIEPLDKDEQGNFIPKQFCDIKYTFNGIAESARTQFSRFVVYNNQRDGREETAFFDFAAEYENDEL